MGQVLHPLQILTILKALGIKYYLHCSWRPQSSGKVKRANKFSKAAIWKIPKGLYKLVRDFVHCPFMHQDGSQSGTGPKLFWSLIWEAIPSLRPILDSDSIALGSYAKSLSQFQQALKDYRIAIKLQETKKPQLYSPGIQVVIKVYKDKSPAS